MLLLTIQQYDRCLIDERTHKILTIRELPRMVQIVPQVDHTAGLVRVSFPPDSEIELFEIALDPSAADMAQWQLCGYSNLIRDNFADTIQSRRCQPLVLARHPGLRRSRGRRSPLALLGVACVTSNEDPKPRRSTQTGLDPQLDREFDLQDDCPLHVLGKESVRQTTGLIQGTIGTKGISEERKERELDWLW